MCVTAHMWSCIACKTAGALRFQLLLRSYHPLLCRILHVAPFPAIST
jgi:hypothetical protein